MINEELDEHNAKLELLRLNGILQENNGSVVLLIGGLAVQRYVSERRSKDLDIVCDLSTQKDILENAYSNPRYEKVEKQTDLRPVFEIRDNQTGNMIFLGSKILERDPYPFIDYDVLVEDSIPFHYSDQNAELIRVPNAHALAFAKMISFISRRDTSKGIQDLTDFAKLTNNRHFSLNNFITLSQRMKATEHIDSFFKESELSEEELDILAVASPIRFQTIIPVDVLPRIYERNNAPRPVFNSIDSNFKIRSVDIEIEYSDIQHMKYTKTKKLTATKNNVGSFYDQFHWTGDSDVSYHCVDPNHILQGRSPKNIWRRYEVDFQRILREGDEEDVSIAWELSDREGNFVPFISVPIDSPTDELTLKLDASKVADCIGKVHIEVLPLMGAGSPVENNEVSGAGGIYIFKCQCPRLLHTYEMRWIIVGEQA